MISLARIGTNSRPGRLLAWLLLPLYLLSFVAADLLVPDQGLAWGEFTIKDEAEMGKKFNVLVRSRMPLVMDPEVVSYVEGLVNRLAASLPPQPFPFTVSVLRDNAVNAFACPGGYLFVHTGLIMAMNHESEVAGVLAHEMAHITQRHIAGRIEKSQAAMLLSLVGALAGAFLGGQAGPAAMVGSMAAAQTAMLKYSRADESDADQVGMTYLLKAGYPPLGMANSFRVIQRRQNVYGSEIPSYLATHPAVRERIAYLTARVQAMPAKLRVRPENDKEFLRIQAIVRARYGDPEVALQAFTEQKKSGDKCVAEMGLGVLYSRLNKVSDASAAFTNALKCNPKDETLIREAGTFHYLKGDKNLAAKLLQNAIFMAPNDYMALFYYARLLADSGENDRAIGYFREVMSHVPEDSEVRYYYAMTLGANKNLFQAHLQLAYSALYENNKKKTVQYMEKAKGYAVSQADKTALESFENEYKERRAFWD